MATPFISFRNVTKIFDKRPVLKNISFDVHSREIFGLIGPSGAGKSTILKLLTTVYAPTSGEILIKGNNIYEDILSVRKMIGFSSQSATFYENLTCLENLEHYGRLYGLSTTELRQRSKQLLKMVDLFKARKKLASKLSGGMQRRLDLALALIHDPQILVLDEPTAGLDPLLRKQIWHIVENIQKAGKTIIVSSHELGEIEYVCNKTAIIKEGQILLVETPEELKRNYSAPTEEIELITYPGDYNNIANYIEANNMGTTVIKPGKILITVASARAIVSNLVHLLDALQEIIVDLNIKKTTLGEIFEAITKNSVRDIKDYYVKEALEKGLSKEQIKAQLLKQNIPKETIEEALK